MKLISVYITYPSQGEADRITRRLLEERLVACGNIFPIKSTYWWQGSLSDDQEWACLLKSSSHLWREIIEVVETEHPYDVPCVVKYEIEANSAYEKWIMEEVR